MFKSFCNKFVTFFLKIPNVHVTMAHKRGYKGDEILPYLLKSLKQKLRNGDVLLAVTAVEHLRFFAIKQKVYKDRQRHKNIRTADKVMPYQIPPNGFAGGRLQAYAVLGRHNDFNLHYFRPYLFWWHLKKSCLSHFHNKS